MPRIFVFGSNLAGRHGKGAALAARLEHGAQLGIGMGRTGNAYAIPTKDANLKTLPIRAIQQHVQEFLKYAKENPNLEFVLTPVGTGLAGYKHDQIAPLFKGVESLSNVSLPDVWKPILKNNAMPRKLPRPTERGPILGSRDIGRNTIFGNPYDARGDPLGGGTIPYFKTYLKRRMMNEPIFRKALLNLAESSDKLWCPGCGPRGKNCVGGVCHGGTIIDALEFMINNPDFKFADRGRLSLADLIDPTQPTVPQFVNRFLR